MERKSVSNLHPDLVIDQESALDRMGAVAMVSLERNSPSATKQVQIVRAKARSLCSDYRNCRIEDWCFHCESGQRGYLFRGEECLGCKLLTADAHLLYKQSQKTNQVLVQLDVKIND